MTTDVILRPGALWDSHYRGARYHCSPNGKVWWSLPSGLTKIRAISGADEIAGWLLAARPDGGSFRITETGAVVTKIPPDWTPVYLGDYSVPLEFEYVDVLGIGLEPLDIWPSFYDGARYSYKRGRLWWKNPVDMVWQQTRETLPQEVEQRLLKVKPAGGSLRITENAKVLALIVPQPLPRHLKTQYDALTDTQKRLIAVKAESTELLPIYIGDCFQEFTLFPPQKLTDPLSPQEAEEILTFLMKFDRGVNDSPPEPFDAHESVEDEIDRGGPE